MPISSLIVSFEDNPSRAAAAALLADHPQMTIGPGEGMRFPVVLETDSVAQDQDAFFSLQNMQGVTSVQLVFLDFSDVEAVSRTDLRGAGRRTRRPDAGTSGFDDQPKNERTSA